MQLLTIPEVADRLRITRQWTYVLARAGVLPTVRIGRTIRVDANRLNEWINQGGTPQVREHEPGSCRPLAKEPRCLQ